MRTSVFNLFKAILINYLFLSVLWFSFVVVVVFVFSQNCP